MKQLGISLERLELMGKPSLGAHYERMTYSAHKLDDGARCVICGRKATDAHHIVPRSTIHAYTVDTPLGKFTALSPLFALCRECHDGFHTQARYHVSWKWRSDQYREEWENGHTLAHICPPGSSFLLKEGCYVLKDKKTGRVFELGGAWGAEVTT